MNLQKYHIGIEAGFETDPKVIEPCKQSLKNALQADKDFEGDLNKLEFKIVPYKDFFIMQVWG